MNFQKITQWIMSSFDTHSKGASARKLTVFLVNNLLALVIVVWLRWAWVHNDWNHLEYMVGTLVFYGSLLLGLTTAQNMREKKLTLENEKPTDSNQP